MSDAQRDPVEGPSDDDAVGVAAAAADASDTAEDAPVEISVESLVADLERVSAEREQFLDAYRRSQADFENFRKQSQRRLDDELQRSVGRLVEGLLPVLDACDSALVHGAAEVEPIAGALLAALEKEGLVRIDPLGERFDPAVADAVVHEPGEGGEHRVCEVMRAGYSWNGRVLRPAMVKVTD